MKTFLRFFPLLALVLMFAMPIVASAHAVAPASLVSCAEDVCDGVLPAYNPGLPSNSYADCPSPNRDYTVNMIDTRGHLAGYLYLYSHTGSTCDEAVWGTVHLNSGYAFPHNAMFMYTTRESSGEQKDVYTGQPDETTRVGVYSDAPMLGYEDSPNASDCFIVAVDWYDQYNAAAHTQIPVANQQCYLGF